MAMRTSKSTQLVAFQQKAVDRYQLCFMHDVLQSRAVAWTESFSLLANTSSRQRCEPSPKSDGMPDALYSSLLRAFPFVFLLSYHGKSMQEFSLREHKGRTKHDLIMEYGSGATPPEDGSCVAQRPKEGENRPLFSELGLTFTFAICRRPSVCRPSVCHL